MFYLFFLSRLSLSHSVYLILLHFSQLQSSVADRSFASHILYLSGAEYFTFYVYVYVIVSATLSLVVVLHRAFIVFGRSGGGDRLFRRSANHGDRKLRAWLNNFKVASVVVKGRRDMRYMRVQRE